MRHLRVLPLVLATFCTAEALPDDVGTADPGYVLHEWGTFTTVAGSDGVLLEGIHADDHALPPFVHSREREPAGFAGAQVKMETPVIYLYSDREREVRVRVRFPGGLLTTWYPQVRAMAPAVGDAPPALKDGMLDWGTVKVLAPGLGTEGLPPVEPGDPWAFAREPESNVLRVCGPGTEHERYLFYRGLGRLDLPMQASLEDGLAVLRCADLDAGAVARVVRVEGGRIRSGVLVPTKESAGAVRAADLAGLAPTKVEDLERALTDEITCSGLTRPEAIAMVRTWRRSWLESPGTRVLVPVPRRAVDALLPLEADPAPRETVRVLVARLDLLTPEEERRAEEVARTAADGAAAAERLGRWAVPILRRVARTSPDPEVARRADALAGSLEPRR